MTGKASRKAAIPMQDHTELLVGMLKGARMLRKRADKLREQVDFSGYSGRQSADENEHLFAKADGLDHYAGEMIEEYHRGCRRQWLEAHPGEARSPRGKAAQS